MNLTIRPNQWGLDAVTRFHFFDFLLEAIFTTTRATMAELLRLFVSATNDLEFERAIIGRAVAELPVQIGIEIRRTPVGGARYDDIYELVANCDRVYFLMGRDITAPAGAEWHLAWQLERSVLALRRYQQLTPAAEAFMRNARVRLRAAL